MPSYWYLGFGTLSENHTARPSGRMCLLKNSAPIKAYIDHACARPLQWVIRHFLASRYYAGDLGGFDPESDQLTRLDSGILP